MAPPILLESSLSSEVFQFSSRVGFRSRRCFVDQSNNARNTTSLRACIVTVLAGLKRGHHGRDRVWDSGFSFTAQIRSTTTARLSNISFRASISVASKPALGDWIIYYEPRKVAATRGYFALVRVIPDPEAPGMYLALIEPGSYLDFSRLQDDADTTKLVTAACLGRVQRWQVQLFKLDGCTGECVSFRSEFVSRRPYARPHQRFQGLSVMRRGRHEQPGTFKMNNALWSDRPSGPPQSWQAFAKGRSRFRVQ